MITVHNEKSFVLLKHDILQYIVAFLECLWNMLFRTSCISVRSVKMHITMSQVCNFSLGKIYIRNYPEQM